MKTPSFDYIKKITSKESLIKRSQKLDSLSWNIYKHFIPNKVSSDDKLILNSIRGELMANWWNDYFRKEFPSNRFETDLNGKIDKKIDLVDLVFQEDLFNIAKKEIQKVADFDYKADFKKLSDKINVTADILYLRKMGVYNVWLLDLLKQIKNKPIEEMQKNELQFYYQAKYYDDLAIRGIIFGMNFQPEIKTLYDPLSLNAGFTFSNFFKAIVSQSPNKLNEEKLDIILENTFSQTLMDEASSSGLTSMYMNNLREGLKDSSNLYELNIEKMVLEYNEEILMKNKLLIPSILNFGENNEKKYKLGCPMYMNKSIISGKSVLKDIYDFEQEIYKKIYLKF